MLSRYETVITKGAKKECGVAKHKECRESSQEGEEEYASLAQYYVLLIMHRGGNCG